MQVHFNASSKRFHRATPLRWLMWVKTSLLALALAWAATAVGQVANYTRSYDNARTGANLNETILTPANVNSASFGKLFTVHIDGQIYAQPLYVPNLMMTGGMHNVVFVASMLNTIYALDADTGLTLWTRNYGPPIKPKEVQSDQNISWNTGLGILSTPVVDPATKYMYFVTHTEVQVNGVNVYQNQLNAIDILTGQPVLGSPVSIAATYQTADLVSPLVFNAKKQNQRPSLVLSNGNVYIAWASHNDTMPYQGWVMAYSASTLAQTGVYVDTTSGIQGGIWQAGSGIAADKLGNVYLSTGNGSFGKTLNGLQQTGNSFIKLSPTLQLLDYFTPYNSSILNASDQDLGASGLLLIPGTDYVLGGGKQGVFYLADTVHGMGGFDASIDHVRQEFQAVYGKGTSHIHGTPAYFNSSLNGPTIYVWGENDYLRAYQFDPSTNLLNPTPISKSSMTAPATNNYGAMPGGFTSVSAKGTTNGIVWASTPWNGDAVHAPAAGVLYAFDANTLQLLWSDKLQDSRDEVGRFAKYVPPVIANGKVYIPNWGAPSNTDGTGNLVVYGLLPQLTVTPANLTVNKGAAIPTLTGKVTGLTGGDVLGSTVVVTYSTTATASSPSGTYPIMAKVTGSSAINYKVVIAKGTLTINADQPPTNPGSEPINFADGFTAGSLNASGTAKINGTKLRLTDGGFNEAAAAFYPTPQSITSFTNDFNFQLTQAAADGFAMVIHNAGATALGANGGALGYGPGIAKSVAVKFDIYNNAGEGLNSTGIYVNGSAPMVPSIALPSSISIANGHIFHVHAVYDGALLNVSLTDTTTGAVSTQSYPIDIPGAVGSSTAYIGFTASTGAFSAVQDILNWVYTPASQSLQGFSAGNLALNGGTVVSGTKLRLADGGTYEARSAFFRAPVDVQAFKAAFTFQMTNPVGDGFAFVLQGVSPETVGGYGGSLGYGPILPANKPSFTNSAAVKFDLFQNASEGENSTGIYLNGAPPTIPFIDLTGTGIDLHSGDVFNVNLSYDAKTLVVTILDTATRATATQSYKVDLPAVLASPAGYVGFTAGTGQKTSTIEVSGWSYLAGLPLKPVIVYPAMSLPYTSSGPAFRVFQWNQFSDGNGMVLDGIQSGENVTLTLNVPTSGVYNVSFDSKQFPTRGIYQLSVDGLSVGQPFDEYSAATDGTLKRFDLGNFNLAAGKHSFMFTAAGKNPASSSSTLAVGHIILGMQ
jgi:outer membrane protein assembly factor BamB